MGPFLKRYRELVVTLFLLVFPLLTYASHAEQTFVPGVVRRAVVWVTSPIQRAMVWTADGAQDAFYGYVDLRGTHERNGALLAQTHRLRDQATRVEELEAENGRLRRLASFAEGQPELRLVAATVIAVGPDPKFRGIRIGRGSQDGIAAGMPVVTPEGVVGRIHQVYDHAADVMLVIDPASAVAGLSQRTRTRATARGIGDAGRLRLDFVVRADDLEEGDILVTAPSGGLYPKGLRIGRATKVQDSAHGLFKTAELVPAVDFARLEEVQVVVENAPNAALTPAVLTSVPQ